MIIAKVARNLVFFTIVSALFWSIPAQAGVSLKHTFFTKRPKAFQTDLQGGIETTADDYAIVHRFTADRGLTVEWHALAVSAHCLDSRAKQHMDDVVRVAASWLRRLEFFPRHPTKVGFYLVPEDHGLNTKAPVFRNDSGAAHVEFGIRLDCSVPNDAITKAGDVLVHEATHIPFLKQDLPIISNEAIAYTMQTCARMDMDGRLPKATLVAHTLPDEMLEPFRTDTPHEYLKRVKSGHDHRNTLVGGVLAQMNLGLFLGLAPIDSEHDPRANSLRQYCGCVLTNTPDFESTKPGAIWAKSNGMRCTNQ